jgi:ABC-type antimicrobial peptide transport system permease subunit
MLLGRVTILAVLGIITGLIVTWWAADAIGALLCGIRPRDPGTITASAGVLALVTVLAGWLPKRRAARLDPAAVLRDV